MVERIEQAVILAAGEGQRLRPFTALKPKVMISLANKPILQYVIEAAAQAGVRKLVLVVGYRKEQVWDYFGSGEQFGVEIDYVVQSQQLGTAHALRQVNGKVKDSFLVLSGDNIVEPETIADLLQTPPNAVLVKEQENVSKYGVVVLGEAVIADIVEKPKEAPSHLVSTGIYLFTEDVFQFIQDETDLPSALRGMIASGHEIAACKTSGGWLDVVYPWDILKLNDLALAKLSPSTAGTIERGVTIKGPVAIGKGTIIRANSYVVGPAIIGEGCELGPSICIRPSTSIGNNVCIFPFTTVQNSVIGDNVEIGPSSAIQDSIIDRGCRLGGQFMARSAATEIKVEDELHYVQIGAMIGEYCSLEDNVSIVPGVILGNHSQIRAFKLIRESIPDLSLVL